MRFLNELIQKKKAEHESAFEDGDGDHQGVYIARNPIDAPTGLAEAAANYTATSVLPASGIMDVAEADEFDDRFVAPDENLETQSTDAGDPLNGEVVQADDAWNRSTEFVLRSQFSTGETTFDDAVEADVAAVDDAVSDAGFAEIDVDDFDMLADDPEFETLSQDEDLADRIDADQPEHTDETVCEAARIDEPLELPEDAMIVSPVSQEEPQEEAIEIVEDLEIAAAAVDAPLEETFEHVEEVEEVEEVSAHEPPGNSTDDAIERAVKLHIWDVDGDEAEAAQMEEPEVPTEAEVADTSAGQMGDFVPPVEQATPRRAGRVRTRLLGFHRPDECDDNPFDRPQSTTSAGTLPTFPVAWLVIEKGPGRGASFALMDGVSRIGRGDDQAVQLNFGDTSVSRDNHAVVAYDNEQRTFFIGHGGKANLVRLNGMPVLATEELNSGDRIRIGETGLRFVALCGQDFNWIDETDLGGLDVATG